MATNYYSFDGTVEWAFVQQPHKMFQPPVYCINFYPKDDETRRAIKATGLRNNIKEDKDGKFFYSFRRLADKGPIKVLDASGEPFKELIGNGSGVKLTMEVYDYTSNGRGGKGGRIDTVQITSLVPFERKVEVNPEAEAYKVEAPQATKKVPF